MENAVWMWLNTYHLINTIESCSEFSSLTHTSNPIHIFFSSISFLMGHITGKLKLATERQILQILCSGRRENGWSFIRKRKPGQLYCHIRCYWLQQACFNSSTQLKKSPKPAICPEWKNWLPDAKPLTERAAVFAQWLSLCCRMNGKILASSLPVFRQYYQQRYW